MPGHPPFIEVGFDPAHSLGAKVLRGSPGTIDALIDHEPGPESRYRGIVLVQGLPAATVDHLLAGVSRRYGGEAQVVRRDEASCVYTYDVPLDRVDDGVVRTMLAVQAGLGAPWSAIEAGHMTLRAEAPTDAPAKARQVRKALGLAGVEAPVRVVRLRQADRQRWAALRAVLDELGERAFGRGLPPALLAAAIPGPTS